MIDSTIFHTSDQLMESMLIVLFQFQSPAYQSGAALLTPFICPHRHGSPETWGQVGAATSYSTLPVSGAGQGASDLSDCAHNLSLGGAGQAAARPVSLAAAPEPVVASPEPVARVLPEGHTPRGLHKEVLHPHIPH